MSASFRQACREGDKERARRALQVSSDGELPELVERIGGPRAMVRFLVQRRHVLDPEPVTSTLDWVRGHLAEAEPIHLLEVEPALAAAEAGGHDEIARRLRSHLQFLQPPDPMRWSRPVPSEAESRFLWACRDGELETASAMLEASPELASSVDARDADGVALASAHGERAIDLVAALADAGARPSARTLGRVAAAGATGPLEHLLERDWPTREHIDDDALRFAAMATTGELEPGAFAQIAARLVEAGADPNACDRWGRTVWSASAPSATAALEGLGARPEATGVGRYDPQMGMSATLAAIVNGDPYDADVLDLNEAAAAGNVSQMEARLDAMGQTPRLARFGPPERPMHLAALMGQVEALHLLIARGYSPAETNTSMADGHHVGPQQTWGQTAVTVAAARGQGDAIYVLMNSVDFVQGRRARRK